jgi:hypothetical protein
MASRWKNACDNVEATSESRDEWRKRARAAEKQLGELKAEHERELSSQKHALGEDAYDKWERECEDNDLRLDNDELRARIKVLESNELENAEDYDRVKAERDDLKAKLDASMPLPLDADGVPCRIGDKVSDSNGMTHTVCEIGDGYISTPEGPLNPEFCQHVSKVAPKPETIEDVRKAATDAFGFGGIEPMIDRSYECGKRDGGDAS